MTLLRTAVETAISGVHKLLRTFEVPTALINIAVVLAVVHGPLGPCGSDRAAKPFTLSTAPLPLSPSLINHLVSEDVKQHVLYLLTNTS